MQRSALRTILLAVLCLSALTLAASTLDTVQTGGSGFGGGGGGGEVDRPTPGSGDDPAQPRETTQAASGDDERVQLCEPAVKEPPVILAVVVAAILTFLGLYRWRDEFVAIAGTLIVFGPITLLMLVLAECDIEQPEPDTPNASLPNGTGGNGSAGGGGGGSAVPDPSLPILALGALAAVVALIVIAYYLTGDDTGEAEPERSEADEEEEPAVDADDVAEVGRLAGEAADRIEDADDFENQVFRAWREMTRPLNVDRPRSSTPAEFAAAAREAGMSGEHVDRLTELFDQVRYGGREATEEREREAVSLLRSIESEYADVETPADLPGVDERGGDGEGSDESGDGRSDESGDGEVSDE